MTPARHVNPMENYRSKSRARPLSARAAALRRGAKMGTKKKTATKTRTKTKLNRKVKTSKDGPVSESMVKVPFKSGFKLGKFKKLTAPMFWVANTSGYVQWPNSYQYVTNCSSLYNPTDLGVIFGMYGTYIPPSATGQSTSKLYMKGCFAETLFTNQTNDVAHMTLYDCIARRDLTTQSTAEGLYTTPDVAWQQGSVDGGATNSWKIVGSTPFQSIGFTEYYKIFKITTVDLHSGGHHRHKLYANPRKMVNNDIVQTLITSSNTGTIGQWTSFTMVVVHGYPDNLTGGTTVTTASGKIDWVTRKQYEFYPVGSEKTIINFSDTLAQNATESIINDLTGLATTVTTA
jgi:hypothetical protein